MLTVHVGRIVSSALQGSYSKLDGGSVMWALECLTGDYVFKFRLDEKVQAGTPLHTSAHTAVFLQRASNPWTECIQSLMHSLNAMMKLLAWHGTWAQQPATVVVLPGIYCHCIV